MATYVIGDVHGCFDELTSLLTELPFDRSVDRLWLVGDLVNRGPDSLAVLRWARAENEALGERFVVVLGNHDVHLLARAVGQAEEKPGDTLAAVLTARDREPLLDWLRTRPLMQGDEIGGRHYALVHAGVAPAWSWPEARKRARTLERALPRDDRLLARRARPGEPLDVSRARDDLQFLVRARMCDTAGNRVRFSGAPAEGPPGSVPWFGHPRRRERSGEPTWVFGHWAALGLHLGRHEIGLDSGCVWGGPLSAIRLDDGALFQTD